MENDMSGRDESREEAKSAETPSGGVHSGDHAGDRSVEGDACASPDAISSEATNAGDARDGAVIAGATTGCPGVVEDATPDVALGATPKQAQPAEEMKSPHIDVKSSGVEIGAQNIGAQSIGAQNIGATNASDGNGSGIPDADEQVFVRTPRKDDVERKGKRSGQRSPGNSDGFFQIPTLHHFTSSFGVERVLEQLVEKSLQENRRLDHVLLHGGMGSGTTLVARALVRDLAPDRCVELDVLDGVDEGTLRSAIREVRDGGVLLIRHIEVLDGSGERLLLECIGRKTDLGTGRFATGEGSSRRRRSAKARFEDFDPTSPKRGRSRRPIRGNFTLIGTAHMTQTIGYQLRCRFDHLIHLRKDPVGTRIAVCRALARRGVDVAESAYPVADRFLGTIGDVAEQFTQAILARVEIEGLGSVPSAGGSARISCDGSPIVVAGGLDCKGNGRRVVTAELLESIVVHDMPCRLPDEMYAHALGIHLAGRRVHRLTDAEVARINHETGWGETAVRAALVLFHRMQQSRSSRPAA
jgi:hypothetical protein